MKASSIFGLFLFVVLFFLSTACHEVKIIIDSPEKGMFVESDHMGLYVDGTRIFTYNELNHQLVYNKRRNIYRIQDDTQENYLNFRAETMPKSAGVSILCEIIYYNKGEYAISMNMIFECTRIDEDRIWFWNANEKMGVVLSKVE